MSEARKVRIVLAGYGTVGRALHDLVAHERDALRSQYGVEFSIVGVARKDRVAEAPAGLPPGSPNALPWRSGTLIELLGEVEGDVLVEASPTNLKSGQPALGHVRAALHDGLPVVLANKGPLVFAQRELEDRARKAGVPLRYEATVAGCIPVFSAARVGLAGNRIDRIQGILNGTTNYILTRMTDERSDFARALGEAQAKGYAEADPSNDVDGLDAAAKIVILGNAILGLDLTLDKVKVEGIRKVSREAVEVAAAHGFHIKLIAEADRSGTARVAPRLVRKGDPLDVAGILNAVRFTTSLGGPITHVGRGAGGRATAAAILADLLDIFRAGAPPLPKRAQVRKE